MNSRVDEEECIMKWRVAAQTRHHERKSRGMRKNIIILKRGLTQEEVIMKPSADAQG